MPILTASPAIAGSTAQDPQQPELVCSPRSARRADCDAIAILHRRDEEASRKQDFVTLRALIDDDAVVIAPGRAIVRGRTAIDQTFASQAKVSADIEIVDYRFEWSEVEIIGDRAIEWGQIRGRFRDKAGAGGNLAFNVLRILRRSADGTWKVYRTIWNDAPTDRKQ